MVSTRWRPRFVPVLTRFGVLVGFLASAAAAEAQPRGNIYLGYEHLTMLTTFNESSVETPLSLSGAVRFGSTAVEATVNQHRGYWSDRRTVAVLVGYQRTWEAENVRPWITILGGYEHTTEDDDFYGIDRYGRGLVQPGAGADMPFLSRLFARIYVAVRVRLGRRDDAEIPAELRIGVGMGVTF